MASLELVAEKARALVGRASPTEAIVKILTEEEINPLGPLLASREIRRREADSNLANYDPEAGVIDPKHINQIAMFVLFGFIGAFFVVGGIWFFFWARNGGFTYHENDWDDYVSTVLRRKGPNGTILSNVTKSTKLGGGSVYHDVYHDDDGRTEYTGASGLSGSTVSGITAGASDVAAREERKRKIERRKREKKERKRKIAAQNGEDGALIEDIEAEAQADLRDYRHEKPARVGGMNREADGSEWDGSTIPTESAVSASLLDHQQATPTNSPEKKKAPGIRKVYSTADRNKRSEEDRLKAEARRLSRQDRAAALRGGASDVSGPSSSEISSVPPSASRDKDGLRRSYTYQRSGAPRSRSQRRSRPEMSEVNSSAAPSDASCAQQYTQSDVGSSLPGATAISGSTARTDDSQGTKSYFHPIPELRSTARDDRPAREPSRRRRESQTRESGSRRESRDGRESRDREGTARRRTSQSQPRTTEERAERMERRKSRAGSTYRRAQQSDHDEVD